MSAMASQITCVIMINDYTKMFCLWSFNVDFPIDVNLGEDYFTRTYHEIGFLDIQR